MSATPAEEFYGAEGFVAVNTGGGCMVLQKALDNGTYLAVTDANDAEMPETSAARVMVGRYKDDEYAEAVEELECENGAEALVYARFAAAGFGLDDIGNRERVYVKSIPEAGVRIAITDRNACRPKALRSPMVLGLESLSGHELSQVHVSNAAEALDAIKRGAWGAL